MLINEKNKREHHIRIKINKKKKNTEPVFIGTN